MNNFYYTLKRFIAPIAAISLALYCMPVNAELLVIDFDDLAPYEMLPDEYPTGSGVAFTLRNSPPALPKPTTIPFADSSGALSEPFAEGNLLTAGDHPPIPVYEVAISFAYPIDYFAVTALDNEEGFTVVGYLGGSVVAAITNGTYLGWYQSPDGWFRGPVHRAELGTIGGALVFDQIVLAKVGGDMAERFEDIHVNFRELFVDIDIKPGSDSNCENLNGKGVIPVAILGGDLDVRDIDKQSLVLEGASIRENTNQQVSADYEYINDDGLIDLIVSIEDDGSLDGYAGLAVLRGFTLDGIRINGSDYLYDRSVCPK